MMIGYKTGLACILAAVSPIVAAIAGVAWGIIHGGPPASKAGVCDACGYDLTGNISGICPECGMGITNQGEPMVEVSHQTADSMPAVIAIKVEAISHKTAGTTSQRIDRPIPRPFSEKEIESPQ